MQVGDVLHIHKASNFMSEPISPPAKASFIWMEANDTLRQEEAVLRAVL